MKDLTTLVKEQAALLGFQKVGIAPASPLAEEQAHLTEWLSRGYHATMGWMAANAAKRGDPALVLPGARSVVSVAMNYYTPPEHSREPGAGKISRYAWGDDYHDILKERIERLADVLRKAAPDSECRCYVDTGPVMEKVWAERAGIGWIGKHTNLITEDLGSWIFLGEIITTQELRYDTPATDHCGTCRLCIDACPTQAIVEPYLLDANRCISYLTIEHRGGFDAELAEKLEGWIYGCDICQDVCPWNEKHATPTPERSFYPRDGAQAPALADVAAMSAEEFSRRFRKSPVKRAKRDGLARNAAAVLTNTVQKQKGS